MLKTLMLRSTLIALTCSLSFAAYASADDLKQIEVPAGDLASALDSLAKQSGVEILYQTERVKGLRTKGVRGNFTAHEAILRLLEGTPLILKTDETGAMLVALANATAATSLSPVGSPEITLAQNKTPSSTPAEDQSAKPQENADTYSSPFDIPEVVVTGNRDRGYGSLMNTSGRLAKPFQDVPQMANVVNSEMLRDMKRFDTTSALLFVPGVSLGANLDQSNRMRGLATWAHYTDGFVAPPLGAGSVYDIAFTDRIEVVKGPSPGSIGRGDPAGFINYVTKAPTFRRSTDMEVVFGSGNNQTDLSQRYMIDHNGLLAEDGQTAYRFIAVSSKGAETPDFTDYEHNSAMLALKRKFTGRGSLSVNMLASKDTLPGTITPTYYTDEAFRIARRNFDIDSGIPPTDYSLLPPTAQLAYDNTHVTSRSFSTTAILDFKLSEHWSTRQAAKSHVSNGETDVLLNGAYRYDTDGTTVLSTPLRQMALIDYRATGMQSDFVGQYKLPAIGGALEVLMGGDFTRIEEKFAFDNQLVTPQPLNNWNPYVQLPGWSLNPDDKYYWFRQDTSSLYGQLEARFLQERLRFTGSWRKNFTETTSMYTVVSNAKTTTEVTSPVLPAYSVLFKLTDVLSVYGQYSQHIEPPTEQFLYGRVQPNSALAAVRGTFQPGTELSEIGVKGNLFEGRFGFSFCAYDLRQADYPTVVELQLTGADVSQALDSSGFVAFTIPSDTRAKGFEFEGFGKFTNHLTFTLNGTYISSSRTRGVFTRAGQPSIVTDKELASNPNTLAGYFTYSFSGDRKQGLAVTAGWKTIFSGWEILAYSLRENPYPDTNTIVDLGVTYASKDRYEIYVKGNNVFERYFTPTSDVGVNYGRRFMAGVTARF